MHDSRSHPLLEQVPLTVSPFVNLPRAATLPYRYKAMPSALPPTILGEGGGMDGGLAAASCEAGGGPGGGAAAAKPAYVVAAASGTAAHPDDILASCRALRDHVARMQADADATLHELEARIQARDLAERRRVAPGWLDSDDHLLVPERPGHSFATTTTTTTTAAAATETADADAAAAAAAAAAALLQGQPSSTASPSEMAAAPASAAEELHRSLGGLML